MSNGLMCHPFYDSITTHYKILIFFQNQFEFSYDSSFSFSSMVKAQFNLSSWKPTLKF